MLQELSLLHVDKFVDEPLEKLAKRSGARLSPRCLHFRQLDPQALNAVFLLMDQRYFRTLTAISSAISTGWCSR